MATKFPAPNPPYIAARHKGGSQVPKAIVIHGTVSSDNPGTARNIANMWAGPNSPISSAHYTVDPREVIQSVKDHTVAYHCGFNTGSLAIELCDEQTGPASRWTDADSVAILKRAARLAAELALAYDIQVKRPTIAALKKNGPHGMYGHNDSRLAFGHTTHTDPRDFPWQKFIDMTWAEHKAIRAEAAGLKRLPNFKVVHAPLHGVSATREEINRALGRRGARIVNFSEAYRRSEYLASRKKWRATMGGTRKDARGRMVERDVVVMTRKRRSEHVNGGTHKSADASTPLKIAPERHTAWSVDRVNGRLLATVALHPHAVVMDHWNSDRAAEYKKSMKDLEVSVRWLRMKYGKDLDIVVTGDLNYRNVDDGRYWAPRQVFKRLDMAYVARGLDWVAWSKSLKRVKAVELSREFNGQDHPWIEVEFSRR